MEPWGWIGAGAMRIGNDLLFSLFSNSFLFFFL